MISVPVRIVDPTKDLNSYGLNTVDWKEIVESWRVKRDKSMLQVTNKYPAERECGDNKEGTGLNGEDMQMYTQPSSMLIRDHFKLLYQILQILSLAGLMMHVYL
jgi:hypothetical protein